MWWKLRLRAWKLWQVLHFVRYPWGCHVWKHLWMEYQLKLCHNKLHIFRKLLIQSYESAQHNPDVYQQKAKQACVARKRREVFDDDESWLHPSAQRFALTLSVSELWRKINAREASSAKPKGNFRNIFISILITFITQLYKFISWCSCSWGWQRRHAGGIESHGMSLCCAFYIPELSRHCLVRFMV